MRSPKFKLRPLKGRIRHADPLDLSTRYGGQERALVVVGTEYRDIHGTTAGYRPSRHAVVYYDRNGRPDRFSFARSSFRLPICLSSEQSQDNIGNEVVTNDGYDDSKYEPRHAFEEHSENGTAKHDEDHEHSEKLVPFIKISAPFGRKRIFERPFHMDAAI